MQKCSLACSKTGIITSQSTFLGAFTKQTRFYGPNEAVANGDFNHNFEHGNATSAKVQLNL